MKLAQLREKFLMGELYETIKHLYVCDDAECEVQERRYAEAADCFAALFGEDREAYAFSAPGRSEVGGNHTDHQRGHVLAAAVNLDVIAIVSKNDDNMIRIKSQGYPQDNIDLSDLTAHKEEENTSAAVIRGIAAKFTEMGYKVGGFDAYTTSQVLGGSGLSSSAAFEVLVGTVINSLFCEGKESAMKIAQIGQYAENVYFGKPSGLMDQAASSVGGFVAIDFFDKENPVAEQLRFDFANCGYTLCIVDTHASHADLTPDYAAIPREMKDVAAYFGKEVLSEVPEETFYDHIPELRRSVGDRPVLRAMHFYDEDRRAQQEAAALNRGDFAAFKHLVCSSGYSSFMYLQNVYSASRSDQQSVSITLGLVAHYAEHAAEKYSVAWRVHGGGFAGTVQAFVPNRYVQHFAKEMDSYLGEGSCHLLKIRPVGGVQLL